ncbi:hypothetical protein PFISCL1PPCAC_19851, partial [Pristionchus fissidentatus]
WKLSSLISFSHSMDQLFCIDYSKLSKRVKDLDVAGRNISELVHRNRMKNEIAVIFHSEKVSFTFASLHTKSEQLGSALLSTGLTTNDRILLIGSNESLLFISILAAARAKLVFCLISPHAHDSSSLTRIINQGSFKAVCIFNSSSDRLYNVLKDCCPEMNRCEKGRIKSPSLPTFTHLFMSNEDYLHAGSFLFSDLFSCEIDNSSLPNIDSFDDSSMVALLHSMGSTGNCRLAAITHYQLLGGGRAVNHAFGLSKGDSVCVCLPLHRGSLLPLLCLSPFLSHSTLIFPDAEPLPTKVFQCISYYNQSVLLSNGAALRLLLRICQRTRATLQSLHKILLIGERVSPELRSSIRQAANKTQIIAVGYLLSETGSIPIMGDESININKLVGRTISGFKCILNDIKGGRPNMGHLMLSPFQDSTFLGYAPSFEHSKWIDTGDVGEIDDDGNIHIVGPVSDLIYDEAGHIFNHKSLEKILSLSQFIKGAQVIASPPSSFVAVCVPKRIPFDPAFLKAELSLLCRETGIKIPQFFSFLEDFPRMNTRIHKFKLRNWLQEGKLELF